MGDRRVILSEGDRGKIIWRRKINRSCGLRDTSTWLRWGTRGLSCQMGSRKDPLEEKDQLIIWTEGHLHFVEVVERRATM